jgi:hypothetical protein
MWKHLLDPQTIKMHVLKIKYGEHIYVNLKSKENLIIFLDV